MDDDSPPLTNEPGDWPDARLLQALLDGLADPVFVKDRRHRWIAFNDGFCGLLGRSRGEILARSDPDFFPPEQAQAFWRADDDLFAAGVPHEREELLTAASGEVRTIWTRKYPIRSGDRVVALVGIISDITTLRRRIDGERDALLRAQSEMIDQMAVPVLQVWDRTLLVPLVGVMTPRRAALVLGQLLQSITRVGATRVLLDITGVPNLDERSAADLSRAVQAARLLGARAALVGIHPELARTLVALGSSFAGVTIHATLQDGLQATLRELPLDG